MNFTFKKYTITKDSQSKDFNLEDELSLSGEEKGYLIRDLSSFTSFLSEADSVITKLYIDVNGKELAIEKDQLNKSVQYFIAEEKLSEDVYGYLSNQLGVVFNDDTLKSRLVDLAGQVQITGEGLINLIQSSDAVVLINQDLNTKQSELESKLTATKTETSQNFNPEQVSQLDKKMEIESKIKNIQEEIDFYQNEKKMREELNSKIEKAKRDKEKSAQMLESVKFLIANRDQVIGEINKFGNLAHDPALNEKIINLKQGRVEKIKNFLLKSKRRNQVPESIVNEEDDHHGRRLYAKSLIILMLIQLIISIVLYFSSFEQRIIVLGFISILLIAIMLGLVNLFKTHTSVHLKNTVGIEAEPKLFNSNEDRLFVDAAWVNALRSELESLESIIQKRLNGKTIQESFEESKKLEMEYNSVGSELEKIQNRSLTSEEYYKKRRELDILKIEKENLDYSLNDDIKAVDTTEVMDINSELEKVKKEISDANILKNKLPIVLLNFSNIAEELKSQILGLKEQRQIIVL